MSDGEGHGLLASESSQSGGWWGLQVRTCDRCTAGHCGGPGEPRHIWELNRRARLCLGNVLRVPGQGLLPPVMVLFLSEGKFKAAHIILTYGPFTGVEGLTGQLAGFINRSGSSEESSCCRVGRGGGAAPETHAETRAPGGRPLWQDPCGAFSGEQNRAEGLRVDCKVLGKRQLSASVCPASWVPAAEAPGRLGGCWPKGRGPPEASSCRT